jgi:SAM-dependent methyltransferase
MDRLVCPICKGNLESNGELKCVDCGHSFPQRDSRWIDLLPDAASNDERGRTSRQLEMEQAYYELAADPAHAKLAYQNDLGGYRERLQRCTGRVLDVGGGQGLVRHYLPPASDYVVLDPSTSWFDQPWDAIADEFPCLLKPLQFIRGKTEYLPFPGASFDWVLSLWSLNHVEKPDAVMSEIERVLRPGGKVLLSLDDVEPTWSDVIDGTYQDPRFPSHRALLFTKLAAAIKGWLLQPDHLRIREHDLRYWTRAFEWEERAWSGTYLTLVLRKK